MTGKLCIPRGAEGPDVLHLALEIAGDVLVFEACVHAQRDATERAECAVAERHEYAPALHVATGAHVGGDAQFAADEPTRQAEHTRQLVQIELFGVQLRFEQVRSQADPAVDPASRAFEMKLRELQISAAQVDTAKQRLQDAEAKAGK